MIFRPIVIGVTLALAGCGGSGNSSPPPTQSTSKTYNGAGSKWELTLNSDNTCTLTESDSNLFIDATCENLSTGFLQITVTSATGNNAPAIGSVTYGFELSGYMLPFVSFSEDKLLPTIISGNCPTGDLKHNFIVSYAKSNSATSDFDGWGTFGYWESNRTNNTLTVKVYDRNGNLTNTFTPTFDIGAACSNGSFFQADQDGGEDTTAYFSESGGLIWHQESTTDQRIENDFMIPYDDGISSVSQLDGNYIGYTISGNGQTNYTSTPVNVSVSNGVFTLKKVNLVTGVTAGSTHSSFTLNAEISGTRGLLQGLVTEYDETVANNNEGIGCAIDLNAGNSGKDVIICGGMLPDGTKKNLYSAILVSK
ncbi:MAG: hypothetical protein HWE20_10605 [Gammaproteobacteria bacterium]|nr:hypothetical protein [Gammaproteobacteria bacterium]